MLFQNSCEVPLGMTAMVSFFEFVFERLQPAPATKARASRIRIVFRMIGLLGLVRFDAGHDNRTDPKSTGKSVRTPACSPEHNRLELSTPGACPRLKGDYSLDVTRGVDVLSQSVLHSFKRSVTVCDKGGDIDPMLLDEIQCTQVRGRPAI